MKTPKTKKGDIIEIVSRKVSDKVQPHFSVGSRFKVADIDCGDAGLTALIVKHPTRKGATLRCCSDRFSWRVLTPRMLAEEEFKKECHNDAVALVSNFTREEQTQIAIVPLVFYHIIWHYAMLAVRESVSNRVEILKKATRQIRETRRAYDRFLAKDLDSLQTEELGKETDKFMRCCSKDFIIMYYTVNGEFKKLYPKYPYDELRTYAIMALLFIRFVEAHNKRMDALIAERLGGCKNTTLMPAIKALKHLMEAFAGIDERFDFDSQLIARCMKIFANNVQSIDFNLL